MNDRTDPGEPVMRRVAQMLGARGLWHDGTVDSVLANVGWLPEASAGLDETWRELPAMRAALEAADAAQEQAADALAEARDRVLAVDRMRQDAAAAREAPPSKRDAEEAVDDAIVVLDAEWQRFAEAAVSTFVAVREHVASWRASSAGLRGPLEDRERALVAELEQVQRAKREVLATDPWLDAIAELRWVQRFSHVADNAELANALDLAQAEAAANPPDVSGGGFTPGGVALADDDLQPVGAAFPSAANPGGDEQ